MVETGSAVEGAGKTVCIIDWGLRPHGRFRAERLSERQCFRNARIEVTQSMTWITLQVREAHNRTSSYAGVSRHGVRLLWKGRTLYHKLQSFTNPMS